MSKVDETSSESAEWTDENNFPGTNDREALDRWVENLAPLDAIGLELQGFYSCSINERVSRGQNSQRRQLWGPFWHERELAIMVGKTGCGKSALALQIALSIATGEEMGGFGPERGEQRVAYIDFEQEDSDYFERAPGSEWWPRDEAMLRFLLWKSERSPATIVDDLVNDILTLKRKHDYSVFILDNVSWSLDFGANAKDIHERTAALVQRLDHICKSEGAAILLITHTTKSKGFTPFELGDIAGSSVLQKYVRSIFAVGETFGRDSGRYLKQLKSRQAKKSFTNSVAGFELAMHRGLLHMVRDEAMDGPERHHLRTDQEQEPTKKEQVVEYLRASPEASDSEVANAVGCSRGLVHKVRTDAV
jgi:RecA-family ATPase